MFVSLIKVSFPVRTEKWDGRGKEKVKLRKSLTMRAKAAIGVGGLLTVLILTVVLVCVLMPQSTKAFWFPDYESGSRLGVYKNAAVSSDAAPCAPIGREILEKNGSAVDTAIAVLLCMGVVNPQSLGLGGGFLMLIYTKETGKVQFLDAREIAPASAKADMFAGNSNLSRTGGLSIAVPGELHGYGIAHKSFGSLDWKELIMPTIKLCKEGIPVSKHLAKALSGHEKEIKENEAMRKVFVNNITGQVYKEGDTFTRLDLAETLEVIAEGGADVLYGNHELADKFLQDLQAMGSIITKEDMLFYTSIMRPPVSVKLRNNMTLHSVSPPGSGALLAFALSILDGYNMTSDISLTKEGTVLALHRIIEAFKFTYAKRMEMEDDPSMTELVKNLTSRNYADEIRQKIDDTRTYEDPAHYGLVMDFGKEDHGTAHMSVVAANGDAVSVTSTINLYFGSRLMSPSTGIILNNEMDDFASPNITNYFGVPPSTKNHIKAGKRPMSSMCPTIVLDGFGNVRLAVGGNGGTKITTSVALTTLRNLWLGDNIKEAIDGPRFHHQLLPNRLVYEKLFPQDILEELQKLGHRTSLLENEMSGINVGIARGEDGTIYANSDYRKGGEVDGF